jgi:carboxyl-terminal processing protease
MKKYNSLSVWLPVIIAASLALGIFVGNYFINISGKRARMNNDENKLSAILDIIDQQYVDSVNIDELTDKIIPKIFGELDPHTVYIPAKDVAKANEDLEGSFSGIGVSFNMQTDTILVINIIPGGPAEKAGLKAFDRIITINDTVYAGNKTDQNKVMQLLRGENNSVVTLGVLRKGDPELKYFDVTRGEVPLNSVDVAYIADDGIGYLKVSKFGRTTYNEFITALAKLKSQGANSFIIDLRGNTGGYMDAAINMVNEFMPEGKLIVYTEGKAFPRRDVFTNGTGAFQDSPIVVLTDEFAASASEIFSGAIQDNDRGTVIGRRTFGKGLVQAPIPLGDGSEVRLTIGRYYTPSGRCIQKKYSLGEDEEYEQDIYNRFLHGEFDSADSIKLEGEEYKTAMGRTVYGGGGIMPDIFIPRDTTGVTSYFNNAVNSGKLNLFVLEYSDKNYNKLSSFNNYQELYQYLQTQPLVEDFVTYAENNGIRRRPTLINISYNLLKKNIEALIVRNFFDDDGFYPIYYKDDATIKKGIETLKSGKSFPEISDQQQGIE